MTDPKQKLIEQQEKRQKLLDALRIEQERIAKEREQANPVQTVQSARSPKQPPNK